MLFLTGTEYVYDRNLMVTSMKYFMFSVQACSDAYILLMYRPEERNTRVGSRYIYNLELGKHKYQNYSYWNSIFVYEQQNPLTF